MEQLSSKQKMAYSVVATGIGSTGAYYGIKNWKKNGWWKTLAVLGVMQTSGGLVSIATNVTAPTETKNLAK
jgi:hypothetical protein